MKRPIIFLGVGAFLFCAHNELIAQVRTVPPRTRDTVRTRPDTTRRDSAARDTTKARELIKWNEPDSVMRALISTPGYTATRYQGDQAVFNAQTRSLALKGNKAVAPVTKAGVSREQTVLVGDSITFNDSTKIIVARGDTVVLRDPQQQAADVVARGEMAYNVEQHRGVATNISTAIAETGQNWIVGGKTTAFQQSQFVSDTTRGRETTFYVKNGTITSCDDSIPDYHFRSGQIKMVSKNIMVARPAVLYIGEVPVMWLPFIFQDIRSGRRSGVLTPRFGVSELFRNSPTYRRHLENLGYYFAISDYMDAQFALDWRSGARDTDGDPGWVVLNGEMNYRWLDRFITGSVALSRRSLRDGSSNTSLTWTHGQDFSQSTHFRTNINYVTNTSIQRTTSFIPSQVLATIASTANYDTKIGPASVSLGGTRTQYPGRSEVQQTFPSFNIAVPTLSPVSWLEWSPGFNVNTSKRLNMDQVSEFPYRYFQNVLGERDSVRRKQNTYNTTSRFDTPLRIGGFTWTNSFNLTDQESDAPTTITLVDVNDSSRKENRVFAKTFSTSLDWQTGITLPAFFQNALKLTPSVSFVNVDGHGFWLRSEQTGGKFVHQSKRAVAGLSASPTLFALFPGFGSVARFRHSITPILTYNYAPAADISTEFLRALNKSKQGYLGALAQNRLTLGLSHVLEAKLSSTDTSRNAEPKKIKVLSMNLSPLSYDFERARVTHRSGFVTDAISSDFTTDLIPGFRGSMRYSLYQGDVLSDTARFKPFREAIEASFTVNSQSGIFGALTRIFGRAVPQKNPQIERVEASPDDALANAVAATPVAGITTRNRQYSIPPTQGWTATLQYSSSRQRPPTGNGIVLTEDPASKCLIYQTNPIVYQQCIEAETANAVGGVPITSTTAGAAFIRTPPRDNLNSSMSFHLTPKWSGTWSTNYDFQAKKFGSHQVSLQRELHDWRAIFAFTQAPNGNFAFNFFIALNAEPDLKFNYDKQTYRPVAR
ncbi:MAG: putative LPS assembly protein LptD [Gemmatimonadaceae bacterium]